MSLKKLRVYLKFGIFAFMLCMNIGVYANTLSEFIIDDPYERISISGDTVILDGNKGNYAGIDFSAFKGTNSGTLAFTLNPASSDYILRLFGSREMLQSRSRDDKTWYSRWVSGGVGFSRILSDYDFQKSNTFILVHNGTKLKAYLNGLLLFIARDDRNNYSSYGSILDFRDYRGTVSNIRYYEGVRNINNLEEYDNANFYDENYIGSIGEIVSNKEENCKRIDKVNLDNGYSVRHYTSSTANQSNIGTTEIYKDGELVASKEVIFDPEGYIRYYSGKQCEHYSEISHVYLESDEYLLLRYNSYNPQSGSDSRAPRRYPVLRSDNDETIIQLGRININTLDIKGYIGPGDDFHYVATIKNTDVNPDAIIGRFETSYDIFPGYPGSRPSTNLQSGYSYKIEQCILLGMESLENDYKVDISCDVSHSKSTSSIDGEGYTIERTHSESILIPKSEYNLCPYDESLCKTNAIDYSDSEGNNDILTPTNNTFTPSLEIKDIERHETDVQNFEIALSEIQDKQSAGDPVRLESGEFEYTNTLMQVPSVGMNMSFDVTYKNTGLYVGPVGNNFDHSYNLYLREDTEGNIYFHNGKLGIQRFTLNASGSYDYNTAINAELIETGSEKQIVVDDKTIYLFGENNKISSIVDEYYNTMSFSYDVNNMLIAIADTQDREYTLSYGDDDRLESITDFNGNITKLSYYGSGETLGGEYDLADITIVNGGQEKTISFEYADTENHNISQLIDSKGQTYVENIYDENQRVASQVYGNGTIYYNYTLSGSRVVENRVTDRNRNETVYIFDELGNTISREKDGQKYSFEYDENNRLIRETLPKGNGYTYSYDGNGNLIEKRHKQDTSAVDSSEDIITSYEYNLDFNTPIKVRLPNGLETIYTLDTQGNIIASKTNSIEAGNGESFVQETSFEYDSLGRIVKSTDSYGLVTDFVYSGSFLVSQTKGGEQTTRYIYDDYGNILSKVDPRGNITRYEYDEFYNMTREISPEGIAKNYSYDANNNRLKVAIDLESGQAETIMSYDIHDQISETRSEIAPQVFVMSETDYDANQNLTKQVFPNGSYETYEYDSYDRLTQKILHADNLQDITNYIYDDNGNLLETDRNGQTMSTIYDLFDRPVLVTDALGNTKTTNYDKMGNVTESISKDRQGNTLAQTTTQYNTLNLPLSLTRYDGEDTRTTSYIYDQAGNIVTETEPKGNTTSYTYDSLMRLSSTTAPNGLQTRLSYDKNDNIVAKTVLSNNPVKDITTNYTYDQDNRLISETDALGNTTRYSYNTLNQKLQEIDANSITTDYEYDYRGLLTNESREGRIISYIYDSMGNMTSFTDANENTTVRSYDQRNNLTSEAYADGATVSYSYDIFSNLIRSTDANGTVVERSYDDLNRLTEKNITKAEGVLGVAQENYSYDGLGRLTETSDDLGIVLTFSYNNFGGLISESSQTGSGEISQITYSYDDNGNLVSQTYPSGNSVVRNYDEMDRILNIQSISSSGSQNIMNYSYNMLHKTSETLGNDRVTNYSYDVLERLSTHRGQDYSYDPVGNITTVRGDSYIYDEQNRVIGVDYSAQRKKLTGESFAYDFMGNRELETRNIQNKKGNIVNKNFVYTTNDLNQYTDRQKISNKELEALENEEIVLEVGDKGTITDILTNANTELTDVEILTQEEFETPEEVADEVVEEMMGRLLYDQNGNLIGNMIREGRQYVYSYDYKNRLIQIQKHIYKKNKDNLETDELEKIEKIVQISYDLLGRRIGKTFNNGSYRTYTYAGQDIIEEHNYSKKGKLKNSKEFIYGEGVDDILAMNSIAHKTKKEAFIYTNKKRIEKTKNIRIHYTETKTYFYEKDHLGSVLEISDEEGETVESYVYNVFGKPYTKTIDETGAETITNLKKSNIGNTRLYTGREYDRGLGLYYNRARYYDPNLGRFIARDPIGIQDDVNLYAYVGNSPTGFTDIFGLAAKAFVKAYDEYLNLKNKIFGIDGQLNHSFTNLTSSESQKLLQRYKYTENLSKQLHYSRNVFQPINSLPTNPQEAKDQKFIKLPNNRAILHQIWVPKNKWNAKWVSEDGKTEVVLDYKTNYNSIVTNDTNKGTYNFFSPIDEPELHIIYDVLPYREWGNGPNDTSNKKQRSALTRRGVINASYINKEFK